MSTQPEPDDLTYAIRVVAGDTPPRGDKPFTEYGQFGHGRIDKRCVLQARTWVDRAGTPHELTDMTPGYRTNVLGFLRREAASWVIGAHASSISLALYGAIDAEQANSEIAAVSALPAGWTDHTPLGLALHRLNQTTPPALPALPAPVTAKTSDHPDLLRNHDTGTWTVTTYSHSRYDLDLDRRRVRRTPAPATGNGAVAGKPLPADGDWTPLTAIVDCTIGRIMVILDLRDGQDSYRLSTTVQRIQATKP